MATVLSPRASGEFIGSVATDVFVSRDGAKKAAQKIVEAVKQKKLGLGNFKQTMLHPSKADEKAIDWIFLVDTLNFSFWTPNGQEKWTVSWKGTEYTGYFALCAGINRALEEGMDITKPSFYSEINKDQLQHIFRSETKTKMPLMDERLQVLHEAGNILLTNYGGSFVTCVKKSDGNAQKLLQLIVTEFSSYRDEAEIAGKRVALYKRAQILIGDIWACFEGKGLGAFEDIDQLTMFADYRIPQPLVDFGVMSYSEKLLQKLQKGTEMKNGDREEVEIRGCSILAVEMITEEVAKIMPNCSELVNSVTVDHFLWDYRREHAEELSVIPFHQVRCIYY